MQVLEILKNSGKDLYPEDLAFFEAVGLTRDEREMICHENAERLIGI